MRHARNIGTDAWAKYEEITYPHVSAGRTMSFCHAAGRLWSSVGALRHGVRKDVSQTRRCHSRGLSQAILG